MTTFDAVNNCTMVSGKIYNLKQWIVRCNNSVEEVDKQKQGIMSSKN